MITHHSKNKNNLKFIIKISLIFFNLLADSSNLNHQSNIDEIRTLVSKLYMNLNLHEYERNTEQNILKQIEALKVELEPLEKVFC